MKYTAILNDKERELEITQLAPNRYRVLVDGQLHEVDARLCSADLLSVLVDNTSYDISFSCDDADVLLNFRNRHFNIEVLDERRVRMRRVRSELDISGPEIIKTSMPGKVVKVLVEPGQKLAPGTGVIIIEAMKMENEIRCRNGGVVKSVHVNAGQAVEGDVVLIEIEPESQP
ncbi:MAG: acetyl-CoA carboxylase biotin carboxyl carrier protein subunit [Candidatus Aminicenantes bacterium]|nr:MAG: acetyl-CoA carboxylase biotin carboxyl carrier protein subunit [Candidatus Aminicenantes bacterium]